MKRCKLCKAPALLLVEDLKTAEKIRMCEKHFKSFCFGLISEKITYEKIPYGKPAPGSTKR